MGGRLVDRASYPLAQAGKDEARVNLIYLSAQASPQQLRQMLAALGAYVKLAVDVRRQVAINIRPRQGNPSRLIQDTPLREQVEHLVRRFLEGVGI
jgi:hypothetical protein